MERPEASTRCRRPSSPSYGTESDSESTLTRWGERQRPPRLCNIIVSIVSEGDCKYQASLSGIRTVRQTGNGQVVIVSEPKWSVLGRVGELDLRRARERGRRSERVSEGQRRVRGARREQGYLDGRVRPFVGHDDLPSLRRRRSVASTGQTRGETKQTRGEAVAGLTIFHAMNRLRLPDVTGVAPDWITGCESVTEGGA